MTTLSLSVNNGIAVFGDPTKPVLNDIVPLQELARALYAFIHWMEGTKADENGLVDSHSTPGRKWIMDDEAICRQTRMNYAGKVPTLMVMGGWDGICPGVEHRDGKFTRFCSHHYIRLLGKYRLQANVEGEAAERIVNDAAKYASADAATRKAMRQAKDARNEARQAVGQAIRSARLAGQPVIEYTEPTDGRTGVKALIAKQGGALPLVFEAVFPTTRKGATPYVRKITANSLDEAMSKAATQLAAGADLRLPA